MWWEHWIDKAFADKIDEMVGTRKVAMEGGRLALQTSVQTSPYWLHTSGSLDCRKCALWYDVFFKEFGIVHSFCRYNCWKVVSRPRNVRELIQTYNLMSVIPFEYNFINPLPGKAGVDVRPHTGKAYGTFQYARSLAEALRIREMMQYMMRKYLPDAIIDDEHLRDTVFVKRSCTEFEAKIPTDHAWWNTPQTEAESEIEKRIEEVFSYHREITSQPAWLKDKTLHRWLHYANSIGDTSAVDFMGTDLFNVHSRQYDFEDLNPKVEGGEKPKPKVTRKKREKAVKTVKET